MKTSPHRLLLAAALLLSAFCLPLSAFSQGSLTPPGAPGPTMKTLAQIEPRTPISTAPFTISQPGSYYLTTNLTVSGTNAITIATNGVTLDLNGFTLASTAPSASGYGILINNGLSDLAIFNGHIRGGVTNTGSGTYNGPGFRNGIAGSVEAPDNTRITGVSVSGCLEAGIDLGIGNATVVESCMVHTVGNCGINANTIKSSAAQDCGGSAIFGREVSDSRGESHTGSGVYAASAQNCYGSSSTSTGLSVYNTAQNCSGTSSSATGLYANNAQNCYGYSNYGGGLLAHIAIGCSGYSSSGVGLTAYIANSCSGVSSTGPAQSITYKYNMP
ncbi:MAG: hypothetical protein WCL11_00920 [Verrucomicrobiota bacterium]|nr:hypothetical protein [Verrucomicrobiota bacterium]